MRLVLPKDINSTFLTPDLNVEEFIGRFEGEIEVKGFNENYLLVFTKI